MHHALTLLWCAATHTAPTPAQASRTVRTPTTRATAATRISSNPLSPTPPPINSHSRTPVAGPTARTRAMGNPASTSHAPPTHASGTGAGSAAATVSALSPSPYASGSGPSGSRSGTLQRASGSGGAAGTASGLTATTAVSVPQGNGSRGSAMRTLGSGAGVPVRASAVHAGAANAAAAAGSNSVGSTPTTRGGGSAPVATGAATATGAPPTTAGESRSVAPGRPLSGRTLPGAAATAQSAASELDAADAHGALTGGVSGGVIVPAGAIIRTSSSNTRLASSSQAAPPFSPTAASATNAGTLLQAITSNLLFPAAPSAPYAGPGTLTSEEEGLLGHELAGLPQPGSQTGSRVGPSQVISPPEGVVLHTAVIVSNPPPATSLHHRVSLTHAAALAGVAPNDTVHTPGSRDTSGTNLRPLLLRVPSANRSSVSASAPLVPTINNGGPGHLSLTSPGLNLGVSPTGAGPLRQPSAAHQFPSQAPATSTSHHGSVFSQEPTIPEVSARIRGVTGTTAATTASSQSGLWLGSPGMGPYHPPATQRSTQHVRLTLGLSSPSGSGSGSRGLLSGSANIGSGGFGDVGSGRFAAAGAAAGSAAGVSSSAGAGFHSGSAQRFASSLGLVASNGGGLSVSGPLLPGSRQAGPLQVRLGSADSNSSAGSGAGVAGTPGMWVPRLATAVSAPTQSTLASATHTASRDTPAGNMSGGYAGGAVAGGYATATATATAARSAAQPSSSSTSTGSTSFGAAGSDRAAAATATAATASSVLRGMRPFPGAAVRMSAMSRYLASGLPGYRSALEDEFLSADSDDDSGDGDGDAMWAGLGGLGGLRPREGDAASGHGSSFLREHYLSHGRDMPMGSGGATATATVSGPGRLGAGSSSSTSGPYGSSASGPLAGGGGRATAAAALVGGQYAPPPVPAAGRGGTAVAPAVASPSGVLLPGSSVYLDRFRRQLVEREQRGSSGLLSALGQGRVESMQGRRGGDGDGDELVRLLRAREEALAAEEERQLQMALALSLAESNGNDGGGTDGYGSGRSGVGAGFAPSASRVTGMGPGQYSREAGSTGGTSSTTTTLNAPPTATAPAWVSNRGIPPPRANPPVLVTPTMPPSISHPSAPSSPTTPTTVRPGVSTTMSGGTATAAAAGSGAGPGFGFGAGSLGASPSGRPPLSLAEFLLQAITGVRCHVVTVQQLRSSSIRTSGGCLLPPWYPSTSQPRTSVPAPCHAITTHATSCYVPAAAAWQARPCRIDSQTCDCSCCMRRVLQLTNFICVHAHTQGAGAWQEPQALISPSLVSAQHPTMTTTMTTLTASLPSYGTPCLWGLGLVQLQPPWGPTPAPCKPQLAVLQRVLRLVHQLQLQLWEGLGLGWVLREWAGCRGWWASWAGVGVRLRVQGGVVRCSSGWEEMGRVSASIHTLYRSQVVCCTVYTVCACCPCCCPPTATIACMWLLRHALRTVELFRHRCAQRCTATLSLMCHGCTAPTTHPLCPVHCSFPHSVAFVMCIKVMSMCRPAKSTLAPADTVLLHGVLYCCMLYCTSQVGPGSLAYQRLVEASCPYSWVGLGGCCSWVTLATLTACHMSGTCVAHV